MYFTFFHPLARAPYIKVVEAPLAGWPIPSDFPRLSYVIEVAPPFCGFQRVGYH